MGRMVPDTPLFSSDEDLAAVCKRLRRRIVTMIGRAGSGHPGGSLSAVEIVATLYWKVLRHRPADPAWPDRDRFILSKGHAAPVLYAALAECGYFPIEELDTLRKFGSHLQGHADRTHTPGVEMSSGSLGQGLSFATGVALAARLDSKDYRTYALLSDGECEEGQTWEAAMAAGHQRPSNLVAIVDYNKFQLDGALEDIIGLEPLAAKWESMGWVVRTIDGHDLDDVLAGLSWATEQDSPACLVAHTVKGKGVSFMEGDNAYHGKAPTADEKARALAELSGASADVGTTNASAREAGR